MKIYVQSTAVCKHTLDLWGLWLAKHDRNKTTTQLGTEKAKERNSTKCLYLSFFKNSEYLRGPEIISLLKEENTWYWLKPATGFG